MNETTGALIRSRRPGPRRAGRRAAVAAAVAPLALLAVACGGGGSSGANAAAGTSTHHQALAYASCMRSHGEPGFPDPDSHGGFDKATVVRAFRQTSKSVVLSASRACGHLMPQGLGPQPPQLSPGEQQQLQADVLKAARCIRAHGVPNFPDPTVDSYGHISVGGGINPDSPQVKSALQACEHFVPAPYRPHGSGR
jgi:hypothetical protein